MNPVKITYEKVPFADIENPIASKPSSKSCGHFDWPGLLSKLLTHIGVLGVYTAILFSTLRLRIDSGKSACSMSNSQTPVFSPAQDALPLHVEVGVESPRGEYPSGPFAGDPGTEADDAWRHLLRGETSQQLQKVQFLQISSPLSVTYQ